MVTVGWMPPVVYNVVPYTRYMAIMHICYVYYDATQYARYYYL